MKPDEEVKQRDKRKFSNLLFLIEPLTHLHFNGIFSYYLFYVGFPLKRVPAGYIFFVKHRIKVTQKSENTSWCLVKSVSIVFSPVSISSVFPRLMLTSLVSYIPWGNLIFLSLGHLTSAQFVFFSNSWFLTVLMKSFLF